MTTTVRGLARRPSLTLESYTDLTGVDATTIESLGAGWVEITFPAELTADQVAAVVARLESVDDADQADRAVLRDLVSKVAQVPKGAATMTAADRRFLIDAVADLALQLAATRLGDELSARPPAQTD